MHGSCHLVILPGLQLLFDKTNVAIGSGRFGCRNSNGHHHIVLGGHLHCVAQHFLEGPGLGNHMICR